MSKKCPMCKGRGYVFTSDSHASIYDKAYKLREAGYSFREIALAMGLNHASQSKHYYEQYKRINRRSRFFWWNR